MSEVDLKMKRFKNLKELIEECEKQYEKRGISFGVGSVFGGFSMSALLQGNYEVALVEGLLSAGILAYGFKKRSEYKKFKDELTDKYDVSTKVEEGK